MSYLKFKEIESTVIDLIIELIGVDATLQELDRSFTEVNHSYYMARVSKVSQRKEEIESILAGKQIGFTPNAPIQQFLVTEG
jgi:hypothetical protein